MASEESDIEDKLLTSILRGKHKEQKMRSNSNSADESDDDDYEDKKEMKYNIVISIDDPSLFNEYFSDSEYEDYDDEEDEDYNEKDDIDYDPDKEQEKKKDKEKIREYGPITRLKKLKQQQVSNDVVKKTSKKDNNEDSAENTEPYNAMLDEFLKAKLTGEDQFKEVCDKIVNSHQKRMNELKEEKEREENKKIKNTNYQDFRKLLKGQSHVSELKYFSKLDTEEQQSIITAYREIAAKTKIDEPYKISLIKADIPCEYKVQAMRKLNIIEYMDNSSNEYYKIKQWIDTFMKIPFGKYIELPLSLEKSSTDEIQAFMSDSIKQLNNIVYGLDDAKFQIMQMLGQWISNPKSVGNAIAIKGPMGTGKTTLVKEGVSKILNRPFAFIALGGATDSSFLEGHSYTYEGSLWGKIADILISSKYMNPVIYFDELDKISDTPRGEEIAGILTHLTDTAQNDQFHDKYFAGINFDLSRALFIFSYNDESKINPILKDRMYHIETKGYNNEEKNIIANQYLMPKIRENVSFNEGDIIITDEILEYINSNLTNSEKGVRNLKRCIEIIHNKINLYRLMEPGSTLFNNEKSAKIELPYTVTIDDINTFIKKKDSDIIFSMYT